MKHSLPVFLAALLCAAGPALADHNPHVIDVKVNGMVCDFCAQSVMKVFDKEQSVQKVDISLDDGLVILTLKDNGELSDKAIKDDIYYTGYDLVSIRRHADEM
jgi:copper chaperone CopZ